MKGQSEKTTLLLTILGGCVALGLGSFFSLVWQVGGVEEARQESDRLSRELEQLRAEEKSYTQARADYQRIGARAAEISALFPPREQLLGQVKRLENAARQSNDLFSLSITDVTPEPGAEVKEESSPIVPGLAGVEVIPYDFRLLGSFLSIIHFLQLLEHQPFYSEIETFTLQSQSKDGQGLTDRGVKRSGAVEAKVRSAFYAKKK